MPTIEVVYPNGRPEQSATEKVAYTVDATQWTDTPTSPTITAVYDESDGSDVTSTVMPSGSPTVNNAIITLPLLQSLTAGKNYRIEFFFTGDNSSRLEAHIRVRGI